MKDFSHKVVLLIFQLPMNFKSNLSKSILEEQGYFKHNLVRGSIKYDIFVLSVFHLILRRTSKEYFQMQIHGRIDLFKPWSLE